MKLFFLLSASFLLTVSLSAQEASIREEKVSMKTYMFSDPDPVPNIGRIYPYSRFDGFTNMSINQEWNMVILENELIEVWVCPDIGGKVWGAKEKSTGGEFLYHNHVVKFRDVAMRGPWTSGGLEFNFGDIGHIPTCATPVDYLIRENNDGSVCCIVGALDLPSGTRWNIEVKVSPGKAYFETKVSWFNNTELPHTYYHWMNAAAKADGDLEFIYPGSNHIGHGGQPGEWPVENNREISWYKNNNFGPYKSYHVVNSYSNFFGGYWHDDNFGFGHMSNYDDKPGKKLWIWGLSDQGMIWEDLLTDDDGQYIEFQAGKLFNQAAESSTLTPFKHREFQAADADIMKEVWFPVKETGGIKAVSEYAVLNIEYHNNKATIILSALQSLDEDLHVTSGGVPSTQRVQLEPLQLFKTEIDYQQNDELKICLGDNLLNYSSNPEALIVDRPILPSRDFNWESVYGMFTRALELEKQRSYSEALAGYLSVVEKDPGFLPALSRLSLAYYRRMDYPLSLDFARKALSVDSYDADANYMYGLCNLKLGNTTEALSGFSIASHSPLTRAAAYQQLAALFLRKKNYEKSLYYADRSLAFNRSNISAYELMAINYRMQGKNEELATTAEQIYDLDALSDLARFEEVLIENRPISDFSSGITNEFPSESYLDLAIKYFSLGDKESAKKVLQLCQGNTIVDLWLAYLNDQENIDNILRSSGKQIFPHRVETADMLKHYIAGNDSWILKYYLALIYWNKGLISEAEELFVECGEWPDKFWFWLSKAELFEDNFVVKEAALKRAFALEPESWRTALAISEYYIGEGLTDKAADICEKLLSDNPENPKLGLGYALALFKDGQYIKCLDFLEDFVLLPYEGSVDGKKMYSEICIKLAMESIQKKKYNSAAKYAEKAKEWPLNLGVGRPYDVDERLEDFLYAFAMAAKKGESDYSKVSSYILPDSQRESSKLLLQVLAMEKEGKRDEALKLIDKHIYNDSSNIYLKWVQARFTGDSKLSAIEAMIVSGDQKIGAYDTKFIDKDFMFLLETLNSLDL